jgi:hypothetical protein
LPISGQGIVFCPIITQAHNEIRADIGIELDSNAGCMHLHQVGSEYEMAVALNLVIWGKY